MAGWGKLVTGVVLGVAGTVYATNEELRKQLPEAARDLPDTVRRRFKMAVEAAREGASDRRQEILRDLEEHEVNNAARPEREPSRAGEPVAEPALDPAGPEVGPEVKGSLAEDDTGPIYRPTGS